MEMSRRGAKLQAGSEEDMDRLDACSELGGLGGGFGGGFGGGWSPRWLLVDAPPEIDWRRPA